MGGGVNVASRADVKSTCNDMCNAKILIHISETAVRVVTRMTYLIDYSHKELVNIEMIKDFGSSNGYENFRVYLPNNGD